MKNFLRPMIAIVQKELRVSMWSFSTYLIFAIFSMATGLFFFADLIDWNAITSRLQDASLSQISFSQFVAIPFFMNTCLALILLIPLMTARSLSEEKKLGTFELLLTYPISDAQIVLGKWFANVIQVVLLLLVTAGYFAIFRMLGGQISLKVLIPPYVGLFAIAFLMVSLSLLLSSLTASHSVAVILGFFAAVLFWMFGWVVLWIAPGMYSVMKGFWVVEHMREYAKGVLDTGPTIFYFAWTVFFLFVTSLTLESRNWKR